MGSSLLAATCSDATRRESSRFRRIAAARTLREYAPRTLLGEPTARPGLCVRRSPAQALTPPQSLPASAASDASAASVDAESATPVSNGPP